MTKRTVFTVNTDEVLGLARRLGQISGEDLQAAAVASVNEAAESVYETARKNIVRDVNVDMVYLNRKMRLDRATKRPSATITAEYGARERSLGQYDPIAQVVAAKSDPSRLKGNKALGIPVGQKQLGASVEVIRGSRSAGFVPRGFLMPLKQGSESGGNGLGLFARDRRGKEKHRYGLSVRQMFRVQATALEDSAAADLGDALVRAVTRSIEKALE